MRRLNIIITSYNRGPFLRHCVESIEACMPYAGVCIRDDASDDPETCQILAELAQRYPVSTQRCLLAGKHGGLYAQMQQALDAAEPDTLLMYLQDDVQLVRPVSLDEIDALYALYQRYPDLGFISPTFVPTSGRTRDTGRFDYSAADAVYWPQPQQRKAGVYYSDICLCLPRRLQQNGWQFGARESHGEAQARALFRPMAIPFLPFVAWLPLVPAFRSRHKTWALAAAERRRGAGFHPFALLDAARCAQLRARPPEQIPYAESMLELRDAPLPGPWHHKALQGQRLLQRINSLETRIARLWQAVQRWFARISPARS